jgi:ornithine cyclodeaminase/alanine dehydrogenase-like protein (mu-crystallin family)
VSIPRTRIPGHNAAVLVLSAREIEDLLDLDRLVDVLGEAMADLSAGRASMPPRVAAAADEHGGLLAAMPAHLPSAGSLGAKLVSVFPGNEARGIPSHQAVIVAFDPATGTPLALMDATYITAARTAAGSALATRLLARGGARVIAILGTGVQARSHAHAVPRVMDTVEEVRVAGRTRSKADALAEELREGGLPARSVASFEEAQVGADVVCATTHSAEPVVRREWLKEGVHVNSVGFNVAGREVDADTVVDALVVVESRASALADPPAGANDLTWVIREGRLEPDDVVEVGELVAGTRPGRASPDEITLYRSVGVAVEDVAAAAIVLEAAHARRAGVRIEM